MMMRAFGDVNLSSGTTIIIVIVASRFVTPAQRHRGEDKMILNKRHDVYEQARQKRPERWARNTRNWESVGAVNLNPEREDVRLKEAA